MNKLHSFDIFRLMIVAPLMKNIVPEGLCVCDQMLFTDRTGEFLERM